jgi:signal transduction histidine kinase
LLVTVLVLGVFWVPSTAAAAESHRLVAGWVLAATAGAAMLLRRRLPITATVAAGVATVAGNALGTCEDPMLAAAWCLYPLAVARARHTRELVLIFAGLLSGLAVVTGVPAGEASGLGQRAVLGIAALSVTWLLGTTVGRQIEVVRAAERARVQLEVARDVHDGVGHALGLISAEAGVTCGLSDAGEQELRESLADIEKHAREALEEMQALVRGLRNGGALSSVVGATRAAGIPVRARIELDDDEVDAVVFRIVQESLSNVVKYADGAPCTVDVRREGDDVVVRVRDRGPGARAGGRSGFGLTGMRERARLVGGTVTWGDHPEGGFEVSARVPVRGGDR